MDAARKTRAAAPRAISSPACSSPKQQKRAATPSLGRSPTRSPTLHASANLGACQSPASPTVGSPLRSRAGRRAVLRSSSCAELAPTSPMSAGGGSPTRQAVDPLRACASAAQLSPTSRSQAIKCDGPPARQAVEPLRPCASAAQLLPMSPSHDLKCAWLGRVDVFTDLSGEQKTMVVKSLCEMNHTLGDNIIKQGDAGDRFYILVHGEVAVIKDRREIGRLVATDEVPQFFGEQALLSSNVRTATVRVTSAKATTLSVDRSMFQSLLQPSFVDRRAAAAVARRVLEDAREHHEKRESYQARVSLSEEELQHDLLPVIRVEAFRDVNGAVKRSRNVRTAIKTLKDDAAATRAARAASETKQHRASLVQKLRTTAYWAGKACALYDHVKPDDAWEELRESVATGGSTSDLASFQLPSPKEDTDAKRPRQRSSPTRRRRSVSLAGTTRAS